MKMRARTGWTGRRALRLSVSGILAFGLAGCLFGRGERGSETLHADGEYVPVLPVAPPGWPRIVWPSENPYSPAKAILGRRLFFDPRLSLTENRACSWCHDPVAAFSDPRHPPLSVGVAQGVTTRNSPTLANMAFARSFMLDGRLEGSNLPEPAVRLTGMNFGPLPMGNGLSRLQSRFLAEPEAAERFGLMVL